MAISATFSPPSHRSLTTHVAIPLTWGAPKATAGSIRIGWSSPATFHRRTMSPSMAYSNSDNREPRIRFQASCPPAPVSRRTPADFGPSSCYAAALHCDKECRRRTLYELIVEAKTRRGGDYREHQAMPVNFPCRRRRSTWFGGRIHPAHRFKQNDVKRETASWCVTVAISCTSWATRHYKRLEMRGSGNGY